MKILHTSDWHLGLDFYGVSLYEDQMHILDEIADIAARERVGAVLLAGDVFDRAIVAPDAIELYNRIMRRLCLDESIPVVACAGNHDGAARLSSLSALLQKTGLHLFGRLGARDAQVDLGETVVHVLPYLTTDDVRVAYPERREEVGSAPDALRVALEYRQPAQDGRRHLLMAHCFAAGGRVGQSDRAAAVGGALAVPTELFAPFDYTALGHLHRPQTLSGARARYSGTPLCYSFAEADQEKSVTLLDTDTLTWREEPLHPLHAVRNLEGGFEELCAGGSEDYVRLVVKDELATASVQEELRRRYPRALVIESARTAVAANAPMLTLEEAVRDTPLDVAEKFYLYKTGLEMDEEQRGWFRRAIEDAEREEE